MIESYARSRRGCSAHKRCSEVNRRLVVVQLYKALGGGWNLTDEQFKTAGSLPGGQSPRAGNLSSRN
jgi:hypothetical protein